MASLAGCCGHGSGRCGADAALAAGGGPRLPAVEPHAFSEHLIEPVCPQRLADLGDQLALPSPQQRPGLQADPPAQALSRLLRLPPLPEVPERLRGRSFVMVEAAYLGGADTGAKLICPLRHLGPELDTFAMIQPSQLSQLHMDPSQPVPNQGDGAFLADAPAAAIDTLVSQAGPDARTPLASIEVRRLGGALARPGPGGAQPAIDAKYRIFAGGLTPTPELADTVRTHAQALKDALAAWHARYDYYKFEKTPATASAVLPPASYHRLQKIKATYDPGQVIISTHPVWPARH